MREISLMFSDTQAVINANTNYSTGWFDLGYKWFKSDQFFLSLDVSQNCNLKVLQSDDGTNDNKFFMPLLGASGLDIGANVDLVSGKYTIALTPTARFAKIKVSNGAVNMNNFLCRAVCFGK